MSAFDTYVFVLCLIVFVMLAGLSTAMILHIYSLTKKLIVSGAEDDNITTEYRKIRTRSKTLDIINRVFSTVLLAVMCCIFAFSVYIKTVENKVPNGVPSLKIVKSASMSCVHKNNKYLTEKGINDRIQTFDLIVAHHIPDEYDLKLYDIVLYETDDKTVIHRIVNIEEPNEEHPDCRYFALQGDANPSPDKIPVYYSQMKGIYYGERIPFIGSFVMFMQSPAGWMCIILIIIGSIASPLMEKNIDRLKRERLIKIGVIPQDTPDNPIIPPKNNIGGNNRL